MVHIITIMNWRCLGATNYWSNRFNEGCDGIMMNDINDDDDDDDDDDQLVIDHDDHDDDDDDDDDVCHH